MEIQIYRKQKLHMEITRLHRHRKTKVLKEIVKKSVQGF